MKTLTKSWELTLSTPKITKSKNCKKGSWVVFVILERNINGLYLSIEECLRPLIGYNPSPTSLYLHSTLEIIIVWCSNRSLIHQNACKKGIHKIRLDRWCQETPNKIFANIKTICGIMCIFDVDLLLDPLFI